MATKETMAATKEIVEGSAIMTYPADQEQTVFYNPVQVQNRDLSILMLSLHAERRRVQLEIQRKKKDLKAQGVKGDDLQQQLKEYKDTLNATELVRKETTADDGMTILDALAASGLRSIRYWKEIPGVKHVTINDLEPAAVERAHLNVKVNQLSDVLLKDDDDRGHGIHVQCGDATHEMYMSRRPPNLTKIKPAQAVQKDQYDVIDLDPYGSAAPFIDGAVQAVCNGGMLCVTCTDMAALGGSHPETAYGRYASMPIPKSRCLQEVALRILLHTLAVSAARYGRTIKPILSVGMAFYVRVFVEVHNDKAGVNDLSLKIGTLYQSTQCASFYTEPHGTHGKNKNVYQPSRAPPSVCEETGGAFKVGGPIWLGPLHDLNVVQTALERLESNEASVVPDMSLLKTKSRLHGLLTSVVEELPDAPLYYNLPDLCHTLHCQCPPIVKVHAALHNAGYQSSGYHKEPQAIKTNAPNAVVWDILREWCSQNPPKLTDKHAIAKKILETKPSIEVDFTIPAELKEKKKATRFPENPEPHWGPKPRASGHKRKSPSTDEQKG